MNNLNSLSLSLNQLCPNQIANELSRRHLIHFTKQTKPDFIEGWFNRIIAKELQQFYLDVINGKQPRLMIFAPPRSGKSELFSRRFPAWVLGQNPNLNIIAASYSADLASRMNRDVQRIIDDPAYNQIFKDTVLSSGRDGVMRTNELFEIKGAKGAYRSAGVGGGITGMGADIGIIDDPVKDAKEAVSETTRNAIWEWYTTTFYTRLSPNSGILLGMTRWHEDDLAGRLLKLMSEGDGDNWRLVSFPAIAEVDEEHRKIGEALHPERYPVERLEKIKRAIGSYAWNGLYQQAPTAKGGAIIRGEWFGRYPKLPILKWRAVFVDTAQKTKEHNDFTVFLHAGFADDGRIYIIDVIRARMDAVKLETTAKDLYAKWREQLNKSRLRHFAIEDKASGTGLIQQLKARHRIPVKAIQRSQDKYSRVLDIQGNIESGFVMLPESAPWIADFIAECEAFTANNSHAHDDQVDALADCVSMMLNKPLSMLDMM
ncbi:phage terminase large subunit [Thorsellia anophelis]|uniref:Phage uncharacterized protein (Putative large terminase), C-terminal domain-containing protein n=1 Tax=Thorsellia anophelis DSM 18579 TaxID=1123402 RepID=A0A1I0CDU7_9GAMM|nr:phage terminase large subunit [Thorsellia anophelis]SET17087.1 phage uncharacterized protein (putative large terminase), C-terminal domain-containing protein [Thorsellia anophelis DSM 18579]